MLCSMMYVNVFTEGMSLSIKEINPVQVNVSFIKRRTICGFLLFGGIQRDHELVTRALFCDLEKNRLRENVSNCFKVFFQNVSTFKDYVRYIWLFSQLKPLQKFWRLLFNYLFSFWRHLGLQFPYCWKGPPGQE